MHGPIPRVHPMSVHWTRMQTGGCMHMGACTWGHAHGGMHMGAWAWGGRMLLDAYARRMHYVSLERSHLPCTREQRLSELEDGDLSEGAGGRAPLCD